MYASELEFDRNEVPPKLSILHQGLSRDCVGRLATASSFVSIYNLSEPQLSQLSNG